MDERKMKISVGSDYAGLVSKALGIEETVLDRIDGDSDNCIDLARLSSFDNSSLSASDQVIAGKVAKRVLHGHDDGSDENGKLFYDNYVLIDNGDGVLYDGDILIKGLNGFPVTHLVFSNEIHTSPYYENGESASASAMLAEQIDIEKMAHSISRTWCSLYASKCDTYGKVDIVRAFSMYLMGLGDLD